ncbi:MAG TPA: hypothetical protein DDW65_19870 [Firmicutes bacterium]|nr:hypothetical protein [Bacillota bacterium]
MDCHIQISDLIVGEITTSSGIFSGENYHYHWTATSKTNSGLNLGGSGNASGNCLNAVYSPKFSDTSGMSMTMATKKQQQGVPE